MAVRQFEHNQPGCRTQLSSVSSAVAAPYVDSHLLI